MEVFDVGGIDVLVIKDNGAVHAYQARCPHQDIPLIEGRLEKGVLTCRAHLWQFAAATGRGLNPSNCRLERYPVRISDGRVCIGDQPIE